MREVLLAFLAIVILSAPCAGFAMDAATISDAIGIYNAHKELRLPLPDQTELSRLVDGEVVTIRERIPLTDTSGETRDRHRFVGYRVVENPRLLVWLAALDTGVNHSRRTVEHHVSGDGKGGAVWYQHIELPWPVRDRHWVIETRKDVQLSRDSNALIWEHAWALKIDGRPMATQLLQNGDVPGLDARDDRRAIYLPLNRGAWTMFALDDRRTLVATHLSTVLAGWIPDSWVAGFVSRQYKGILGGLAERSANIAENFSTEIPVFTGEGRVISRDMAREAGLEN